MSVEGPCKREKCDFSTWHRVIENDGSTIAYVPDEVTAYRIDTSELLLSVCREIADDPRCDLVDPERRMWLYAAISKADPTWLE